MKEKYNLSIGQAAQVLGWYPERVQYHLKKKNDPIPYIVRGGHKLFDEEELLEWKSHLIDNRTKTKRKTFYNDN